MTAQSMAAEVCLFALVASNAMTINVIKERGRWVVAAICNWAALAAWIVLYHQS
jgi:hypothetical protein